MLEKEIAELQKVFNVEFDVSPKEQVIVRVWITAVKNVKSPATMQGAQVILDFLPSSGYPFATLECAPRVVCGTVAGQEIRRIADSVSGYGAITRICQSVRKVMLERL